MSMESPANNFVALDLETTGLSAETERIVEIGAVRFDHKGLEIERFQTLVNPERMMPPGAQAVHGITDGQLVGCRWPAVLPSSSHSRSPGARRSSRTMPRSTHGSWAVNVGRTADPGRAIVDTLALAREAAGDPRPPARYAARVPARPGRSHRALPTASGQDFDGAEGRSQRRRRCVLPILGRQTVRSRPLGCVDRRHGRPFGQPGGRRWHARRHARSLAGSSIKAGALPRRLLPPRLGRKSFRLDRSNDTRSSSGSEPPVVRTDSPWSTPPGAPTGDCPRKGLRGPATARVVPLRAHAAAEAGDRRRQGALRGPLGRADVTVGSRPPGEFAEIPIVAPGELAGWSAETAASLDATHFNGIAIADRYGGPYQTGSNGG